MFFSSCPLSDGGRSGAAAPPPSVASRCFLTLSCNFHPLTLHERPCLYARPITRLRFRFISPKEKGGGGPLVVVESQERNKDPALDHPFAFEIPFFRSPGPPPGYHHFSRTSKIPQRPCIDTGTSLKYPEYSRSSYNPDPFRLNRFRSMPKICHSKESLCPVGEILQVDEVVISKNL